MAEKLKPKGGTASVMEIAKSLRAESSPVHTVENEISNEIEIKKEVEVKKEISQELECLSKDSELAAILLKLKDRDKEQSRKGVLYVDDEVKEVFMMLKAKAKIPISSLVSYILEKWLTEHEEEIATLIKRSKNRFL